MNRRRRGLPAPDPVADFSEIKPDPSRVGGVAEAPFARLPDPASLFADRARRLAALAVDHPLGAYLDFLAAVVRAQAGAIAALPAPSLPPASQLATRAEHAMPALAATEVDGSPALAATLSWLLDHVALETAPAAACQAADAVRTMPEPERWALAADILQGAYPFDRIGESLFVAAALQVHLARLAAYLDAAALVSPALGICPVCGGAPVASVVVGWTQASKARYCACALCGTLWNHVRVKCTACGATDGIAYSTIEGATATIGVETCTTCRSYIKHMQQHADAALDPVADDVASYALDLLAAEQGFRRANLNPLFLTG